MNGKLFFGFNLTLKASEEQQLRLIFQQYADETGHINLAQFLKFCYEKRFVTNQSPLFAMFNIFVQAAGDKPYLKKARFFYSINLLGRLLYPDDILPLEPILTRLLSDVSLNTCYPAFDDSAKSLLAENILRLFQNTESGFFQILATYNSENIKKGRKVKGVQEIKSKNLGISPRNLLRYFKMKKGIFPELLSVEDFHVILQEVYPATDAFVRKYYSYGNLLKFYYNDNSISTLTKIKDIFGEPELKLTDLQMLFGKIALAAYPNIEDLYKRVFQFFETKLSLSTQNEIPIKYAIEEDPYILFGDLGNPKEILKKFENAEYTCIDNAREKFDLADFIQPPVFPSLEEIEKLFETERVPPLPPPEKIMFENPPPFVLPPIRIPLKGKADAIDSKSNPTAEKNTARAGTPSNKIKFTEMPGTFHTKTPQKSRYESFEKIRKTLNLNLVPETLHQSLANPSINPCLIKEVYNLPNCPAMIAEMINTCHIYQSRGMLKSSLTAILKAKNDLTKLDSETAQKAEVNIFFELTLASIFESGGKNKLALAKYFECKSLFDALNYNNPDQALLYCGLGFNLHHLNNFKLATRSYLMAKRIRERCIGGDTIESAVVYNNLGVCMFNLERYQEAFGYFQLSEAIFLNMLGPNNARTNVVMQNINRVKRKNLIANPEFKLLWAKQFQDPFFNEKLKKVKKKKGKRK